MANRSSVQTFETLEFHPVEDSTSIQGLNDIEQLVREIESRYPDLKIGQLKVKHPGDDDGIWFIKKDGDRREVQMESTYGTFPFLVESDFNNDRILVYNIEEALDLIYRLLNPE